MRRKVVKNRSALRWAAAVEPETDDGGSRTKALEAMLEQMGFPRSAPRSPASASIERESDVRMYAAPGHGPTDNSLLTLAREQRCLSRFMCGLDAKEDDAAYHAGVARRHIVESCASQARFFLESRSMPTANTERPVVDLERTQRRASPETLSDRHPSPISISGLLGVGRRRAPKKLAKNSVSQDQFAVDRSPSGLRISPRLSRNDARAAEAAEAAKGSVRGRPRVFVIVIDAVSWTNFVHNAPERGSILGQLFGACRRQAPRARPNRRGLGVRRVVRSLWIGTGVRRRHAPKISENALGRSPQRGSTAWRPERAGLTGCRSASSDITPSAQTPSRTCAALLSGILDRHDSPSHTRPA